MLLLLILPALAAAAAAADHSGAYSSPQYAKKMYPKQLDHNALLPKETSANFKMQYPDEENGTLARSSLLESASTFLSGAGGQVMSTLAKDFIARSTGSSQVGFECITQVLSLNLTNLVILVVLKALILAAGFFGAGAWKGHHYGRSLDDNNNVNYLTEDEIKLYLSYLAGQQSQDYGCLYRIACQKPQQAGLYSSGAELLLQGTKLLQGNSQDLEQYEEVAEGIKKATSWGEEGMPCDSRYQCE